LYNFFGFFGSIELAFCLSTKHPLTKYNYCVIIVSEICYIFKILYPNLMKKFITSIFLILSLVTTGLMSYTPSVSAINKSAVSCDHLGQYINPNSVGSLCQPCPIDYHCAKVSGTQIKNCLAKGYPDSDCKETRKLFSTDEALKCPAGLTTMGYTIDPTNNSRITMAGAFFNVGEGAASETICQKPTFQCPASLPTWSPDENGNARCVPLICSNGQVAAVDSNNISSCRPPCKTTQDGKCLPPCPDNQYRQIIGDKASECKDITVKKICPITNQVATTEGDLSTCVCVSGQVLNSEKTKCETPRPPCDENTYGDYKPQCIACPNNGKSPIGTTKVEGCSLPPSPCPANQYGYSQPNCRDCPIKGSISPIGTVDSSGCKSPSIPCTPPATGTQPNCINPVPCDANTYGLSKPNCQQCPPNSTSPINTQVASGCVVQQNNGGGEGFCGGGWAWLCGGLILTGVDCFITKIVCNKAGGSVSGPIVNKPSTNNPVNGPFQKNQYDIVRKTVKASSQCISTNAQFVSQVYAVPGSHKESNGNKFFWVETSVSNGKTVSLSTIRSKEGVEVPALKCLMSRFYQMNSGIEGIEFGNSVYMKALSDAGILHGLNKDKKSPGYLKECIDLTRLLSVLNTYGENDVIQSKYQYAVVLRGTKTPVNGVWYNSVQEVKNWVSGNNDIAPSNTKYEPVYNDTNTNNIAYNYDSNEVEAQSTEENAYTTTFMNIFGGVKASAQEYSDSEKEDNSQLFAQGLVQGEDLGEVEEEEIEVIEQLASANIEGNDERYDPGYEKESKPEESPAYETAFANNESNQGDKEEYNSGNSDQVTYNPEENQSYETASVYNKPNQGYNEEYDSGNSDQVTYNPEENQTYETASAYKEPEPNEEYNS
jgi:hypothetical protein